MVSGMWIYNETGAEGIFLEVICRDMSKYGDPSKLIFFSITSGSHDARMHSDPATLLSLIMYICMLV